MAQVQVTNKNDPLKVFPRRHYRVEIKPAWASDWRDFDYVRLEQCTDSAAPTMAQAVLTWLSGRIRYEDLSTFGVYEATDIKDWFVRVTLLGQGSSGDPGDPQPPGNGDASSAQRLGIYVVPEETLNFGGDQTTQSAPRGDQQMIAYGLEYLLDRRAIQTAWTFVPVREGDDPANASELSVTIPFNEKFRLGLSELGNRSTAPVTTDLNAGKTDGNGTALPAKSVTSYVFSDDGSPWTVRQIVDYLLAYHNESEVTFKLGGQVEALDAIVLPKVDVAGDTIYAALNKLIDRRRGLGWCIRTSEDQAPAGEEQDQQATTVEIHVFTTIGTDVAAGDAKIPANGERVTLDLGERGHRIGPVQLSVDSQSRYGKVIVQGAPIVSMFTVSLRDESIDKAWTTAEENAYKAGSGDGTNAAKNDAERATDKFDHVFTTFRMTHLWNWKAGDGTGVAGQKHAVNVRTDDNGDIDVLGSQPGGTGTPVNFEPAPGATRSWGHVLLDRLPLPVDQADANFDKDKEFRKPLVLLKNPTDGSYVFAERAGASGKPAANVRMLDRSFGFQVKGPHNHLLALNRFAGAKATAQQPQFDYFDLIATVAVRLDERLKVVVNIPYQTWDGEDPDVAKAKTDRLKSRVLYINVPDAELWYCAPNTAIDVKDGKLVRQNPASVNVISPRAMVLRTDAPRLRQIAALAKAWYGVPRAAITVKFQTPELGYRVGSYVTAAQDAWRSEPVNSVVTQKVYTFAKDALTTSVRTSFAELDSTIAGPSSRRSPLGSGGVA